MATVVVIGGGPAGRERGKPYSDFDVPPAQKQS